MNSPIRRNNKEIMSTNGQINGEFMQIFGTPKIMIITVPEEFNCGIRVSD